MDRGDKIKMLVSTMDSQGARADDFCHAPEGEPVWFPLEKCRNDQCGCNRSLIGFFSRKKTTTFKIETMNIVSAAEAISMMTVKLFKPREDEACHQYARSVFDEILQMGRRFNEGDILEIQGNQIVARQIN